MYLCVGVTRNQGGSKEVAPAARNLSPLTPRSAKRRRDLRERRRAKVLSRAAISDPSVGEEAQF